MLRYILTIFLSAFLLFQVQPLIAKYILPWFGGSPAVWTTCMLFFQVVLLAGYCYAHVTSTWLKPKVQSYLHIALLLASLALLPIIPAETWKPEGKEIPTTQILLLLLATIGIPYGLLSTTGPLLQKWFSRTTPGRSPYRLFALSNFGSLLALLSYPTLVEPNLNVETQAVIWSVTYGLFVAGCIWCAWQARDAAEPLPEAASSSQEVASSAGTSRRRPTVFEVLLWFGLSATASLMLLAITNQMCQEVAVVPFLWVLPLSLYLLSFILTFESDLWYQRWFWTSALLGLGAVAGYLFYQETSLDKFSVPMIWQVALLATFLFISCMLCHGELAKSRPHAHDLTLFYLVISVGGAFGGIFNVLIAPEIFNFYGETYVAAGMMLVFVVLAQSYNLVRRAKEIREVSVSRVFKWVFLAVLAVSSMLLATRLNRVDLGEEWLRGFVDAKLYWYALPILLSLSWFLWYAADTRLRPWAISTVSILSQLVVAAAIVLGVLYFNEESDTYIERTRNFYGVLTVKESYDSVGDYRYLVHGTIFHGQQYLGDYETRRMITSYYAADSGIGLAIRFHPARGADETTGVTQTRWPQFRREAVNDHRFSKLLNWFEQNLTPVSMVPAVAQKHRERPFRLGVIGLGTGSLATYGRGGDELVFYDINPAVVKIAREQFTYLEDCPANVEVVVGDARIQMERELANKNFRNYDVLAVDAFSSDAIPRHLLTEECFEIYRQHLAEDGVLAVHISNRHLDLKPVVCALAENMGFTPIIIDFDNPLDDEALSSCTWALCTKNEAFLNQDAIRESKSGWPEENERRLPWTDSMGSLLDVLD